MVKKNSKGKAVKTPAAPKAPTAPKVNHFDELRKIVNSPSGPSGCITEVQEYLQRVDPLSKDKKLGFVLAICHQQETSGEKRQLIGQYLNTVK